MGPKVFRGADPTHAIWRRRTRVPATVKRLKAVSGMLACREETTSQRKARVSRAATTASSENRSQNVDMLKELVRERLLAAADEIFGLFQTTVASYEQQLCRAREESERHRRQLEAVCKTQIVIRVEDVKQLMGRRDVKLGSSALEQEYPQAHHIKEEEEEAGVSGLPRDGVSEESDDDDRDRPTEWSRLHPGGPSEDRCGGPPREDLFALLSGDGDDAEDALGSAADCEDAEQLTAHEKDRSFRPQRRLGQECPQAPLVKEEEPQPSRVKEEDEEADVSRLPLTGVSVKTEDDRESSPLHRDSPSGDRRGGPPPDALLAPLSDGDDSEESLRSGVDCASDDGRPECSREETAGNSATRQERTKTGAKGSLFGCSTCGKMFSIRENLLRHVRTHTGEKPFSCSTCGKNFTLKANMVKHQRTHVREKPFRCSMCGKRFTLKAIMEEHQRTHSGEKPYSCSACGRTFSQRVTMVKHMRTHTGEKPYSCSTCGRTFSHRGTMVAHVRTHTGEKPFTCSTCGRTFSQKGTMVTHMRRHTGEKPFPCQVCGKSYAQKVSLALHVHSHHADK